MGETLDREEIAALFDTLGRDFYGIRDRAYLSLLYRCGLRNNECRMLDVTDLHMVDEGPAYVLVRHPKGVASGAKPRAVGLDAGTQTALRDWLRQRTYRAKSEALFVTVAGERMSTNHFRRKLKLMRRDAGVSRRVHPHALRHTFARSLHDEGVSMRLIQLALGHRSLATTAAYLQSLGDPEVIAATSEREW